MPRPVACNPAWGCEKGNGGLRNQGSPRLSERGNKHAPSRRFIPESGCRNATVEGNGEHPTVGLILTGRLIYIGRSVVLVGRNISLGV